MQKLSLEYISPYLMNALRFLLLAPFLIFFPKPQIPMKNLFLCAFFWSVLNFTFAGFSLTLGMGPGLATFIFQTAAFFGIGFAFFLLKERLTSLEIGGLVIAFCGVWVILSGSIIGNGSVLSILSVLISSASCGLGNVLLKMQKYSFSVGTIVWLSTFAALPFVLIALAIDGFQGSLDQVYSMNWTCIRYLLFASFGSTFFGGYLWCNLLARNSITYVAPFMLLLPFFASLMSYLVIEEILSIFEIIGGAVIISGLLLVQVCPLIVNKKCP